MDEEREFREFVASRGPALMRTAYLLTGDAHLAEDLLQNVLTRTAARWRRIQPEKAEAYARTAIYREFFDWRRVLRNRELPAEDLPAPEVADFTDRSVRRMVIRQALARLPRRQRAVILLRYFEDLSVNDTADLLGCTPGTVKRQTFDALARLREHSPELADLLTVEAAKANKAKQSGQSGRSSRQDRTVAMTRFTEELRDLADQAPALGDLDGMADRALASARLRQRMIVPLTAAGLVATVTALAVAIGSMAPDAHREPQKPPGPKAPFPKSVELPDSVERLPSKAVEPAMFGYLHCPMKLRGEGRLERTGPCSSRIMTVKGRAFDVRSTNGDVTVSPDGRKIAYLGQAGQFVVRDLASGAHTVLTTWDVKVEIGSVLWTADGRKILIEPSEVAKDRCVGPNRSLLLEIATRKRTSIPSCLVYGITNEGAPFPARTQPGSPEIPLFDHSGARRGEIPPDLVSGTPTHKGEELHGLISPDGKLFAAWIPFYSKVRMIDLEAGRMKGVNADMDPVGLVGWTDPTHILLTPTSMTPEPYTAAISVYDTSTGETRDVVEIRRASNTIVTGAAYRLLGSG